MKCGAMIISHISPCAHCCFCRKPSGEIMTRLKVFLFLRDLQLISYNEFPSFVWCEVFSLLKVCMLVVAIPATQVVGSDAFGFSNSFL